MTRRELILMAVERKIGTILKENGASEKPAIIEAFVEMFSEENPRFDEDKFREFVLGEEVVSKSTLINTHYIPGFKTPIDYEEDLS